MKKKYEKPQIMFEDFTLTNSIAGDCEIKVKNPSRDSCPYQLRTGEQIFISNLTGCITHEDDGDYNGICYHVPIESNNLFAS